MGKLPRFLYSKTGEGPNDAEYIIHTLHPRCVGKVSKENDIIRVHMHVQFEPVTTVQEKDLCEKMMDFYYYKYVKPK